MPASVHIKINMGVKSMLKRRIVQYTTKMEPIRIYDSIREAEGEYHITHISSTCRGRRRTDGGFIWRYEEDGNNVPKGKYPVRSRR